MILFALFPTILGIFIFVGTVGGSMIFKIKKSFTPRYWDRAILPAERVEVASNSRRWRVVDVIILLSFSLLVVAGLHLYVERHDWVPRVLS